MCGIVGYVGRREAVPVLLAGLRRLEYRGYDSAGIAVQRNGVVEVRKAAGRIDVLERRLAAEPLPPAAAGIGHTRWATHGQPSDENAHPHRDCTGTIAVVHNGIIENYAQLRDELRAAGHRFRSETDTEVVPHLIEALYDGDLLEAVRRALERLEGSYALAVVSARDPGRLVAARQQSPLVVGLGDGECFVASDIPALLPYTRRVLVVEDGELVDVRDGEVRILDRSGRPVQRAPLVVQWDAEAAERGGYPHFMLKEIHEQPRALADTLRGRLADGAVHLPELDLDEAAARALDQVVFVACGTAYHAGLVGAHLVERLARVPARAEIASEFRYRDPLIGPRTLVVAISQSGETADTLAAVREARARGARTLAVANVVGSTLTREADAVLYTRAGPEVAVASTKAYTTQLVAVTLLAAWLGQARGTLTPAAAEPVLAGLRALPGLAERVLASDGEIAAVARQLAGQDDVFFIGRGLDYAVALEGQLKLKEISYIHAEAYPAGELKHGTLALIDRGVPVVALVTQPDLQAKTVANVQEVRARGAFVIAVAREGDREVERHADRVLAIPEVHPLVTPALAVIPLQLLAYHAAVARGCDVDRPRNLAKSVTVE